MNEEYIEPIVQHQLPERIELQKILCEFPKDLNDHDLCQRRIDAVNWMVALCRRREISMPQKTSGA